MKKLDVSITLQVLLRMITNALAKGNHTYNKQLSKTVSGSIKEDIYI